MGYKILTLNLGTTSTRVAVYEDEAQLAEKSLYHADEEIRTYTQQEHVNRRAAMMREWFAEIGINLSDIDMVSMRVATLPKVVSGGTYRVEETLRDDLCFRYKADGMLKHGTDIIIPFVEAVTEGYDIPIVCVEPANQNNMSPEACISGHPLIERNTVFHALNQKYVAAMLSDKLGKHYNDCNFVIVHMGGGISVCAHQKGRVVDTTNCAGNEGPFSATRCGNMPNRDIINLCFSGKYTHEEMINLMRGNGGMVAYLGISDMRDVEKLINEGDERAALLFRAMAYQTIKHIGAMCTIIEGDLDAIIITGGVANSKMMVDMISDKVSRFAPIYVYPGEKESEALASAALRILNSTDRVSVY